jgi:AraC family transcriptional regulator
MARIVPLWHSDELTLHRFDHPPEHEDRPYEMVASAFTASFVEQGTFDLDCRDGSWRLGQGDVLLRHPGMQYRASFEGDGFSDTCLTLSYLAADDSPDSPRDRGWAARPVLRASNRLRYLQWGLRRALERDAPMLIEHCAVELFREHGKSNGPPFRDHKLNWYAERVHAARERLETAFDHRHTVSELARSVGMSMFHFTRVFTELVGLPPHRYLVEARLRAARSMLLAGRSVTETCFACGFGNLSHFSRSFARRYGVSPSRLCEQKFARKCK